MCAAPEVACPPNVSSRTWTDDEGLEHIEIVAWQSPSSRWASTGDEPPWPGGGEEELPASPELAAAMETIRERFEDRWCDESVPALGLTPRQAAADVTRREVVRLLASFPEPPEGPPAASGEAFMRPSRLRSLLGLD